MEQIFNWIDNVRIINPWVIWGGIIMVILICVSTALNEDDHFDEH